MPGGTLQHLGNKCDFAPLCGVRVHELNPVVIAITGTITNRPAEFQGKAIEWNAQLNVDLVTTLQIDPGIYSQSALVQLRSAAFRNTGVVSGFEHQANRDIKVVPLPAAFGRCLLVNGVDGHSTRIVAVGESTAKLPKYRAERTELCRIKNLRQVHDACLGAKVTHLRPAGKSITDHNGARVTGANRRKQHAFRQNL